MHVRTHSHSCVHTHSLYTQPRSAHACEFKFMLMRTQPHTLACIYTQSVAYYIHTYPRTHTHTHTHIHIHILTCTHAHARTIATHTRAHTVVHPHSRTHSCTFTRTCTLANANSRTYNRARTIAPVHLCIHTRLRVLVHACTKTSAHTG